MKHSTVSRIISTEDVTTFWQRFREIFSPQQEKLWDGLLTGLQRYHRVLEGTTGNIFLIQEQKNYIYKFMCFKLVVTDIIWLIVLLMMLHKTENVKKMYF
jgi:hypothetical protein